MSCIKQNQLKIVVDSDLDTIYYSRCSFAKMHAEKGIQNFDFNKIKNFNFSNEKREEYKNDCLSQCPPNAMTTIDFNSFVGCNFRCYHCFIEKHPINQKNIQDTFFILEKLKGNNLDNLCLDGRGEIFLLYKRLYTYLSNLSRDDFKTIFFITNGSLLTSERISELKNLSDKTEVNYIFNVSVDGVTKTTYESSRPGGNFEKTIKTIKELKTYFPVKITFTIKDTNVSDIDNIIPFFNDIDIPESCILVNRDFFNPEYINIQRSYQDKLD